MPRAATRPVDTRHNGGRAEVPSPPPYPASVGRDRGVRRLLRSFAAFALGLLAVAAVAGKVALDRSGPYLEALPDHPFCLDAEWALAQDRVADALELATAGGCASARTRAEARWSSLAATFDRCAAGVWTGRGDDATGVACAIASDLVVFGDVRDLSRAALAWARGDAADPVLVALSVVGLAATAAPAADAGGALLKAARRVGALSDELAAAVVGLVRAGTWSPLVTLFSDAGRLARRLGPAGGARALRYADDADEVAALARFVEAAPNPLLALRWGGKGAVRLADDGALYGAALAKGPDGLRLAAARGGRALLARQPVVVALAKTVVRDPEALVAFLAWLARGLLAWAQWPLVAAFAGACTVAAAVVAPRGRGRRPRRWGAAGPTPRRPAADRPSLT